LDACQKINEAQNQKIAAQAQEIALIEKDNELLRLQRDSYHKDFDRAQEDAKRNFQLFISEHDLRNQASEFVPHGTSGKWAKFLTLFDSSAIQFGVKTILPVWTAARCK